MKEYRKRLYLSVLGMLISLTAGCQTSGSLSGEVKQTNASLSIDVLKDELIYWEPVIQEFQKQYPDVQVEICSYSAEEMVETASKRETELMAGEGKDIYLSIESSGFDFYKVQQSGVFADLYPFFQEESGFSEESSPSKNGGGLSFFSVYGFFIKTGVAGNVCAVSLLWREQLCMERL